MGLIFSDYKKIDLHSADGVAKFYGAVNHFLQGPEKVGRKLVHAGVREFTTTSDFPAEAKDVMEKFHVGIDEIDVGYEQVFNIRDFTTIPRDGFKIRDVSSGLTFAKMKAGQKAKVFKVIGTDAEVKFDMYGGAIGWSRKWFDDEEFWTIEDAALEFRRKWFSNKATAFYGLIEALPTTHDVTWQGGVGNTELDRDIATINTACTQILNLLKTAGVGVTANSQFVIVAPVALKARILRAVDTAFRFSEAAGQVAFAVTPMFTTNLADATSYYVALPKQKATGGNRMNLTILSQLDVLSYSEVVSGFGRFGGIIGEIKQFARCATA